MASIRNTFCRDSCRKSLYDEFHKSSETNGTFFLSSFLQLCLRLQPDMTVSHFNKDSDFGKTFFASFKFILSFDTHWVLPELKKCIASVNVSYTSSSQHIALDLAVLPTLPYRASHSHVRRRPLISHVNFLRLRTLITSVQLRLLCFVGTEIQYPSFG